MNSTDVLYFIKCLMYRTARPPRGGQAGARTCAFGSYVAIVASSLRTS